jgi:hypothetical protein
MANYGSRSSDYVRPGTGHAMDAEERLPVIGPVLVTPHHFPCFCRAWVASLAFCAGFLRRWPASCAITFAESDLGRTYYLWPLPRDSAERV